MLAPRHLFFGSCLALAGCLRPIGFPWQDDAASSSTASAASTSTTSTTTDPATSTTDPSTTADASSTGPELTATTTSSTTDSTTDSTAAETTGSTTEPGPLCGDGHVDPGEDCDDANPVDDDGCNSQCGRDRVVFVTDAVYSGDQLGGLSGADALCRSAAQKAGLANPLTFKAWLSDRDTDAVARLFHGKGRYLRVDNQLVAADFDDLLDGQLANPIMITQTEQVYKNGVWTGTRPDGTHAIGADHCKDWTVADLFDPQNGGYYGYAQSYDQRWTFEPNVNINPGPCSGDLALYCMEQ
jgi:cysteine-rich repeat protein